MCRQLFIILGLSTDLKLFLRMFNLIQTGMRASPKIQNQLVDVFSIAKMTQD